MSSSVDQQEQRHPIGLASGDVVDMTWGVKESFRTYFERLSDHHYDLSGGAARAVGGEFRFPQQGQSGQASGGRETLSFAGRVVLTAHFGALSVRIEDPNILMDSGGRATLSAVVDEVDGKPVRMVVADLVVDHEETAAGHDPFRLCFSASLAVEGQYLFMGNYYAGDPLDAVAIRFAGPPTS